MRIGIGRTVVRRGLYPDGRIGSLQCGRVVADDDRGLLVWASAGSATVQRVTLDGAPTRSLPLADEMRLPTLAVPSTWQPYGTLILTPPEAAHSVWWSFDPGGSFVGWYVNLESPVGRWNGGTDHIDQALDILVAPDRSWRWKDEDEFAEQTGHPFFWTEEGAAAIRAEGERMIALAEAGAFPFDGTWCDFRPDPNWPHTALPWWWDQPGPLPPGDGRTVRRAT
ncbi:hypothetical protein TR51_18460 [Kitasatospora griseola]|uniref:DUF402 domain-containing protein n=1 Tax=Kitasatospora griseola TaxID=2064 RepID=A0A0D0Q4A3_KITGR|nr:DUF402 domain-containing protein [Kitasatospora griseola]KIQ65743.1 hypothetical protein TR51_18460 [Kitasatospora griseola]